MAAKKRVYYRTGTDKAPAARRRTAGVAEAAMPAGNRRAEKAKEKRAFGRCFQV
jgi:hypothetical protein